MLRKNFQKLIVFIIILFPLVLHNTIIASSSSEKESSSESALTELLLQEENAAFLNKLIVSTYEKEKSGPSLQAKMCTHSGTIVQAWKDFIKKPVPSPLSLDQWNRIIGRKEIYVFTTPDHISLLDEQINNPTKISYKIDNRGSIALHVDYTIGKTIGEKYTDTEVSKGSRKKKATSDDAYKKDELKSIRVMIDIGLLIDTMKKRQQSVEKGHDILPESFTGLVTIGSICPQG
jgi:hypothetical protein